MALYHCYLELIHGLGPSPLPRKLMILSRMVSAVVQIVLATNHWRGAIVAEINFVAMTLQLGNLQMPEPLALPDIRNGLMLDVTHDNLFGPIQGAGAGGAIPIELQVHECEGTDFLVLFDVLSIHARGFNVILLVKLGAGPLRHDLLHVDFVANIAKGLEEITPFVLAQHKYPVVVLGQCAGAGPCISMMLSASTRHMRKFTATMSRPAPWRRRPLGALAACRRW